MLYMIHFIQHDTKIILHDTIFTLFDTNFNIYDTKRRLGGFCFGGEGEIFFVLVPLFRVSLCDTCTVATKASDSLDVARLPQAKLLPLLSAPFIRHRRRSRTSLSREFESSTSMQNKKPPYWVVFVLAEKERFELSNRVTGYTISNRAPSTN